MVDGWMDEWMDGEKMVTLVTIYKLFQSDNGMENVKI